MMAAAKAAAPRQNEGRRGDRAHQPRPSDDLVEHRRRRLAGRRRSSGWRGSRATPASTGSSAPAPKSLALARHWPDGFFVVPGVRPAGADVGDQKRVVTPRRRSTTAPRSWSSAARSPARPNPRASDHGHRGLAGADARLKRGHDDELAEPRPQRHSLPAQAADRRESVAQVQEVRDDGVRQGMGGELQRLPALRLPRPDRADASASSSCSTRPNIELLPAPEVREDPLRFKDTKRYTDRLKTARAANGERDALVNARGRIDGQRVDHRRAGFRVHGRIDGHRRRRGLRRGRPRRDRRRAALTSSSPRRAARGCRKAFSA